MKIAHLLGSNLDIVLNNQESNFVNKHKVVKLTALDERDLWLAQNLVRKGIYEISKDNILIKKVNESNSI